MPLNAPWPLSAVTSAFAAASYKNFIAESDKETECLFADFITGSLVLRSTTWPFRTGWPRSNTDVSTVRESWREGLDGVRRAWQAICDEINYVPVFDIAG